jgi:hypothetical protein
MIAPTTPSPDTIVVDLLRRLDGTATAMRLPRPRFTVRTLMILVGLAGLACLGVREYWAWMRRRDHRNSVSPSTLSASTGRSIQLDWCADRPVPVSVTYNFAFGPKKPEPGTTCMLLAELWFEDQQTGLAVEGYTFDAPLTVGGREAASGSFTWEAQLPHPGRYFLNSRLYYVDPAGELRFCSGRGHAYQAVAVDWSARPTTVSGASP